MITDPDIKRRIRQICALAAYGILLWLIYWNLNLGVKNFPLIDLEVYRKAALAIKDGLPLYSEPFVRVRTSAGELYELRYLYPPFLAFTFMPLVNVPTFTLSMLWIGLNLVGVILASYFLSKTLALIKDVGLSEYQIFLLITLFFLSFPPFLTGLIWGQITGILVAVICWYIYLSIKGRASSGLFLALAILLKVTPIFLILPAFRARRGNILVSLVISLLLLVGVMVLAGVDLSYFRDFFEFAAKLSSGQVPVARDINNFSPIRFIYELTGKNLLFRSLTSLVLLLGMALFALRNVEGDRVAELLALSGILVLGTLSSPIIWEHHYAVLSPAMVAGVYCSWQTKYWKFLCVTSLLIYLVIFTSGMLFMIFGDNEIPRIIFATAINSLFLVLLFGLYRLKNRNYSP